MFARLVNSFPLLNALVHRDFRYYWGGHTFAVSGQQMATMTQMWLIFELTGSALQLGLLGLARAIPGVALNLVGGVLADKVDQRRLLMYSNVGMTALYFILATLALSGSLEVWHVMAVVFGTGAFEAFQQPSRQAIFPNLIDRKDMMSAVGLNSTIHPGTRIFAPLIAGVLIDQVGMGLEGAAVALYLVGGLYLTFSIALLRIHMAPVQRARSAGGFQSMVQGFRYVANHRIFMLLIMTSFSSAIFGMAHITLLPVFTEKLMGESTGFYLALLTSAGGVGGLAGAFVAGSLGSIRRRGWLMIGGAGSFGLSLILFAISPWYWLLVALEWLASASNQMFSVTSQSTLHALVPDEYRGRVMGLWGMTHTVAQPLGGLQMGGVAQLLGASTALVISASVAVGFVVFGIGRDASVRNLDGREVLAAARRESEPTPAVEG
ncbi:MAG: MFS transporter [Chloroflexi bacterium]|nr:MFS transporter [Chloroflexota bacterium]